MPYLVRFRALTGPRGRLALTNDSAIRKRAGLYMSTYLSKRILEKLRKYPPERPGQRYKREGRLFRGWSDPPEVRVTPDGILGRLKNDTYYVHIVHGPGMGKPSGQSADMAGRGWMNIDQVVSQSERGVFRRLLQVNVYDRLTNVR